MRTPEQARERAKQLLDGVRNAAAALRRRDPRMADAAVNAATRLGDAIVALAETLAKTRGDSAHPQAPAHARLREGETLLNRAVDLLHRLHFEVIRFDLQETPPETVPLDEVNETAEAIQGLLDTLAETPGG